MLSLILRVSWSTFFSLSLSFSQYPGILLAICTYMNNRVQLAQRVIALYIFFYSFIFNLRLYVRLLIRISFSLFVWMYVEVSGYIITHCSCKCAFLDPCFSLSFCLNGFIRVRLYCDWLYVYRYVSWPSFLSLFLSVSVTSYIIGNFMYMNNRVQLSQGVIALSKFVYACLFYSYFCLSRCLWMSVTVSGYIMTHCMSIYVFFALHLCLSFCLNICISVGLYCHWLYVYVYVSWSVFLSLFLSQCLIECSAILSLFVRVRVYLLIHVSLSLSICLSQRSGILSVNLRVYVRLLIRISLSLFVSECV